MKAPRKTVKRPILRHNEEYDSIIKEEKKIEEDVKLVDPKKDVKTLEFFSTPPIEFDVQEPISSMITIENLHDDNFNNLVGTFDDIFEVDTGLDFVFPIDLESIF